MAKRNAKRNFIAAVVRKDSTSTSSHDQVDEILGFYRKHPGTCCDRVPIDPSIFSSGPLLSREQADGLVRAVSA